MITRVFKMLILLIFFSINCHAKNKIVALLPLSGEHENAGKNILHSIHLASNTLHNKYEIIQINSNASEKEIIQQLLAADPTAIIGPVYSKNLRKLYKTLNNIDVCVFNLSNDKTLINPENCVFSIAPTPQEYASQIAKYASNAHYNVNAILPKNSYGDIIANHLKKQARDKNIHLGEILFYNPRWNAVEEHEVYKFMNKISNIDNHQSVFVPDTKLLEALDTKFTQSNVKFLTATAPIKKHFNNHINYAQAAGVKFDEFSKKYWRSFNIKPNVLSGIAYDSVLIIDSLKKHFRNRIIKEDILSSKEFYGVSGAVKLTPEGDNKRDLAIFSIQGNVLDKAHKVR